MENQLQDKIAKDNENEYKMEEREILVTRHSGAFRWIFFKHRTLYTCTSFLRRDERYFLLALNKMTRGVDMGI